MPKTIRNEFRTNGLRAHIRKRIRGNAVNYEIRCRRCGYNISASGITIAEAKQRFIRKLNDSQSGIDNQSKLPTDFANFALYYFDNFRKRKVSARTYTADFNRLKAHILPHFNSTPLKEITPKMCQMLIDNLLTQGKGKTAEEVFSLLNCTFKVAIKHRLLAHNPLDLVFHEKHDRQHGTALTVEEERHLLCTVVEPYKTLLAIGLYCGLRTNEYATIRIADGIVYAKNSKRKGGKIEYKRIPICPMLYPYISTATDLPKASPSQLRKAFNAVLGATHKLYDLRTTFYTRCQMCGVAPPARDHFMGHSSGELGNAYTDLPNDYLIKEAQKLKY